MNWTEQHIRGGLSSGEGLIDRVRDRTTKFETDKRTSERTEIEDDPGVDDKRLLLVEEEFARTLRAAGRSENTLGAVIRQAWDGQSLATMTRKASLSPPARISRSSAISPRRNCRSSSTM